MTDFSQKTDVQIDNWISNHEAKQATDRPLYQELLEERARRGEARSSLLIEKSLEELKQAAIDGRCVSYGELAKASGVEWGMARHRMNGTGGHLDQLLDVCHVRSLPLLTAICVNKTNVETGELEASALSGFAQGARRLGYEVANEADFHHAKRDECWEWGARVGGSTISADGG